MDYLKASNRGEKYCCKWARKVVLVCIFLQVFRAVITGALDGLKTVLGEAVAMVMEAIDAHIQCWFLQVLQLDPKTLRLEALEINDESLLCR